MPNIQIEPHIVAPDDTPSTSSATARECALLITHHLRIQRGIGSGLGGIEWHRKTSSYCFFLRFSFVSFIAFRGCNPSQFHVH